MSAITRLRTAWRRWAGSALVGLAVLGGPTPAAQALPMLEPALLHRSSDEAMARVDAWQREADAQGSDAARLNAERQRATVHALYGRITALQASVERIQQLAGSQPDAALRTELLLWQVQLASAAGHQVAAAQLLAPLREAPASLLAGPLAQQVQLALARADAELGRRDVATGALTGLLERARREGDGALATQAWLAMARLQEDMRDYARALECHQEALGAAPAWARQWASEARMGVAQMTNVLGERAKALTLLEQPLAEFRASQNRKGEADALLLQAYFLRKLQRHEEGLPLLEASWRLRESLGNPVDVVNVLTHLAGTYTDLGRGLDAVRFGRLAATQADQMDNPDLQWDAHGALADGLAQAGEFRQAYEEKHLSERALLKASTRDLISRTAALREQFETDRQRLENERLSERLAFEQREQSRLTLTLAVLALLTALLVLLMLALVRLYWRTRRQSQEDGLTGLLNRHRSMVLCGIEIERARRHGQALSLLMFDLDEFKAINDRLGHAAGDLVLRRVAALTRGSLRRGDVAGRIGGEEFLLVLPHTDAAAAMHLAERLRALFEREIEVAEGWRATASFGVATLQDGMDADALLQRADQALYRAKQRGRNRAELAEPVSGWQPMPA